MLDEIDVASLEARIESEYREMPGLQLTARQMQRMWCLDGPTCEVIIGRLLAHRIVVKTRRDAYARADRKQNFNVRRAVPFQILVLDDAVFRSCTY